MPGHFAFMLHPSVRLTRKVRIMNAEGKRSSEQDNVLRTPSGADVFPAAEVDPSAGVGQAVADQITATPPRSPL
jgi:hypothetical protein